MKEKMKKQQEKKITEVSYKEVTQGERINRNYIW